MSSNTFIPDSTEPILVEFSSSGGKVTRGLPRLEPEDLIIKSRKAVDSAMNTIYNMSQRVIATMDSLSNHPSQVEVEFGISFDVEAGALVTKAGGEANLMVKLVWDRSLEDK
jgi:hypothetical protein